MSPNTYSLVSVSAREEKRGVDVTFANAQHRLTKFYSFFPSFYLPHTSTTPFESLLHAQLMERHQLVSHPKSLQVMSGTWGDLKKIAQKIYALTHYFPLLIEPERQFLLTQNWRYFQTFDEKLSPLSIAFEETKMEGLAEGMLQTLKELQGHNSILAHQLTQRAIKSHELFVPLTDVPEDLEEALELLLDNHFFKTQTPTPVQTAPKMDRNTWNVEKRNKANQVVWKTPLNNEGNCSCCQPCSPFEAHVQLGSEIDARVTQDGVYIHTNDSLRSQTYHENHSEKEKRIQRAREWGLSTTPMGPLWRGEKITLSLTEARHAHENGLVTLSFDPSKAVWKCKNQPEQLLHQLHTYLFQRLQHHAQTQTELVQPYLTQYQLAYTMYARQNPVVQLHSSGEKTLQEWMGKTPCHLQCGETKWRDTRFTQRLSGALE
jgi:hypothetical protein